MQLHKAFVAGQRFGFDVLPRHFYSSIPDIRELRRNASWKQPMSMIGVAGGNLDEQLAFAAECCQPEWAAMANEAAVHVKACKQNGAVGFGRVEADFLFCFTLRKRPARIVQIGSGVSTSVILQAADVAAYTPEIICIDPYPTAYLEQCAAAGKITLLAQRAQDVAMERLTCLRAGDLLFVDSTHTVKPGSEVNRIIFEVLPRLEAGCHVHFHDINLPYGYQADLMTSLFFWNETSLLHAFLIQNPGYRIAASLSMLHFGKVKELRSLLPGFRPAPMDQGLRLSPENSELHNPTSIYLEVVHV